MLSTGLETIPPEKKMSDKAVELIDIDIYSSDVNELNNIERQYYTDHGISLKKVIHEAKIPFNKLHSLPESIKDIILTDSYTDILLLILKETDISGVDFIKKFELPNIKSSTELATHEKINREKLQFILSYPDPFIELQNFEKLALLKCGLNETQIHELKPSHRKKYYENTYALQQVIKTAGIPYKDFVKLTEKTKDLLLQFHHYLTAITFETGIQGISLINILQLLPEQHQPHDGDEETAEEIIDNYYLNKFKILLNYRYKFIEICKSAKITEMVGDQRKFNVTLSAIIHRLDYKPVFEPTASTVETKTITNLAPTPTTTSISDITAPKSIIRSGTTLDLDDITDEHIPQENTNTITLPTTIFTTTAESTATQVENEYRDLTVTNVEDSFSAKVFWSSIRFFGGACLGMAIMAGIAGSGGVALVPFILVGIASGLFTCFANYVYNKISCCKQVNDDDNHGDVKLNQSTTGYLGKATIANLQPGAHTPIHENVSNKDMSKGPSNKASTDFENRLLDLQDLEPVNSYT